MSRSIKILYRLEVISLLRDFRTVFFSLILPVLLVPVMLFAGNHVQRKSQHEMRTAVYSYAVGGSQATWGRALMAQALEIAAKSDDAELSTLRLHEDVDDASIEAVRDRRVDVLILAVSTTEARELDVRLQSATPDPAVIVCLRSNSVASLQVATKVRRLLDTVREARRNKLLSDRGLPVAPAAVLPVQTRDLASAAELAGAQLGAFATVFLFLILLGGGGSASTDIISGEKERGTLETLLTTAARREDIVISKLLTIASMSLASTVLELVTFSGCIALGIMPAPQGLAAVVSPLVVGLMLVLFIPVVTLAASVLLLASAWANSFREAQMYMLPVMLVGGALCCAAIMPGLPLRSPIVLVPLSNVSVAVRDILVGRMDWPMLALTWLVTMAAALVAVRASIRSLSRETLIMPSTSDLDLVEGPVLFRRRVLRWFAFFWVLVFLADNSGFLRDVRAAVIFNLVGVFFGGTMLAIRVYGLPAKETLGLRKVRPLVWLAVLIGAPAGIVVATGVFNIVSWFMPMPKQLIEEFNRALFSQDIPLWQLLIVIAVLPGICEELAFRGLLVFGLRTRMSKSGLCIAVGLIFGFFHMDIYRVAPTAFLGTLFTWIALSVQSTLPGILWHTLHNGLSVLSENRLEVWSEQFPWLLYGGATLLLCLSLWIVRRNAVDSPQSSQSAQRMDIPL